MKILGYWMKISPTNRDYIWERKCRLRANWGISRLKSRLLKSWMILRKSSKVCSNRLSAQAKKNRNLRIWVLAVAVFRLKVRRMKEFWRGWLMIVRINKKFWISWACHWINSLIFLDKITENLRYHLSSFFLKLKLRSNKIKIILMEY